MLGKPLAIGYTFLWSFVYGFIISIILTLILMLFVPSSISIKDVDGMKRAGGIIIFATLAAAVAQIWLVFGTAYQYGLSDCPEAVAIQSNVLTY